MEISHLTDAIKKSWNIETCYPKNRDGWNEIDPSL